MKLVGEEYEKLLQDSISSLQPSIPFHSSVHGNVILGAGGLNADYWRSNLESPVIFHTAVQSILNGPSPPSVFIEIGPHAALAGPLRQTLKKSGSSAAYISTLQRNTNGAEALLSAVGQMYCQGVQVDFLALNSSRAVLTDLPTYPWHYQGKYWNESRLSRAYRLREFAHHDILGSLTPVANSFEPTWRNILKLDNVPWILDHRIRTDVVFPGAGYVTMIGEAIRQLTGSEDYSVKNVSITSAMVFNESRAIETMAALHLEHLTDSLDSTWYEFSISSYNGTSWTKHCTGQARAGSETEVLSTEMTTDLPRRIPSEGWYQAMTRVGLNYGPAFNGLTEIEASVSEHIAAASVFNVVGEEESRYALHPTTLDLCFQLFGVALARGQSRKFNQLCIPTFIEELYVRNSSSKIRLEAHTAYSQTGIIQGEAFGTANGEIVLKLKGLKLSPVEEDSEGDADPHAAVQLHWKPDIDFLQDRNLMRVSRSVRSSHMLAEKLTVLCILEASSRLSGVHVDQPQSHFDRYLGWIQEQKSRIMSGEYPLVEAVDELATLSPVSRQQLIEETYQATQTTEAWAMGKALVEVLENAQDIINGKTDALEVLLKEDVLSNIYNFAEMWDYKDFFSAVTHEKPHLRILEIGAGTGGTTSDILNSLFSESGQRMYAKYTFTDISAGFFAAAKERFRDVKSIDYAVLDISRDPLEQGFEAHSYDLILASNVSSAFLSTMPLFTRTTRSFMRLHASVNLSSTSESCSTPGDDCSCRSFALVSPIKTQCLSTPAHTFE
jgi:acyl transferase domain-containing protein